MKKLCNTGWEADRLYRNTVTATFTTPSRPIKLTGYRFKLAMIPSDAPFIGGYASAQVLWWCAMFGLESDPADDWGTVTFVDNATAKPAAAIAGLRWPRWPRWRRLGAGATLAAAAQNLHGGANTVDNIVGGVDPESVAVDLCGQRLPARKRLVGDRAAALHRADVRRSCRSRTDRRRHSASRTMTRRT